VEEVKYKNKFIESYLKLVEAKTYFQFANTVCREAKSLFHSNNIKFIYVYNKEGSLIEQNMGDPDKDNLQGGLIIYTSGELG
jgi:hypothetical protein